MTMRGDEGIGREAPVARDRTLLVFGIATAAAFALVAADERG